MQTPRAGARMCRIPPSEVGSRKSTMQERGQVKRSGLGLSGFLDPGRAPAFGVDQLASKYAAGTVGRARLAGKQAAGAAKGGLVRALGGLGCVHLVTERHRGRIRFAQSVSCLGSAAEQDIGERCGGERRGADLDKAAAA